MMLLTHLIASDTGLSSDERAHLSCSPIPEPGPNPSGFRSVNQKKRKVNVSRPQERPYWGMARPRCRLLFPSCRPFSRRDWRKEAVPSPTTEFSRLSVSKPRLFSLQDMTSLPSDTSAPTCPPRTTLIQVHLSNHDAQQEPGIFAAGCALLRNHVQGTDSHPPSFILPGVEHASQPTDRRNLKRDGQRGPRGPSRQVVIRVLLPRLLCTQRQDVHSDHHIDEQTSSTCLRSRARTCGKAP